jgi:hypothetical protein
MWNPPGNRNDGDPGDGAVPPVDYYKATDPGVGEESVARAVTDAVIQTLTSDGSPRLRSNLDLEATMNGFTAHSSYGLSSSRERGIFRTASELTEVHLVPKAAKLALKDRSAQELDSEMRTFWSAHELTGDNTKEKPYAHIYPRVTTKSNAYTVHLRVQALGKRQGTDPTIFEEGKDRVMGEYRGSAILERYVDPSDPRLPDFASGGDSNGNGVNDSEESLDAYYRFRVVSTKQFQP